MQNQLIHGYARLHVNATHFHIEAIDTEGAVFDEAVLTKHSTHKAEPTTQPGAGGEERPGRAEGSKGGGGGGQPSLFARRAAALVEAR